MWFLFKRIDVGGSSQFLVAYKNRQAKKGASLANESFSNMFFCGVCSLKGGVFTGFRQFPLWSAILVLRGSLLLEPTPAISHPFLAEISLD